MALRKVLVPRRFQPQGGGVRASQWAMDRGLVSALDPFGSLLGAGFTGYRGDYQTYPRRSGIATWGRTTSGLAYEQRELTLTYPLSYVTVCAGLTRNTGIQVISGLGRFGLTNLLGFQAGTGQATRFIMRQDGGTAPMTIEYSSIYNNPVSVDDVVTLGISLKSFNILVAQSSLYWDGRLATRGNSAAGSAGTPIYDTHGIGGIYRSNSPVETAGAGTNILLSAVFASELSPDDHAAIARDYLIMYEPQRIFVPVSRTASIIVLTPPLLANTQTFPAASVGRGAVNLTPSAHTNSQTFFAPAVAAAGVTLAPPLLANAQTFFAPAVASSGITLAPSLLTNEQVFYGPSVGVASIELQASLLENTQVFYPALVQGEGTFVQPPLLQNEQAFYSAEITVGVVNLLASLFSNEQTFFAPNVDSGASAITPDLLVNEQVFFGATVTPGAVGLIAPFFVNESEFYSPSLGTASDIQPDFFVNYQEFLSPSVTVGEVTIAPSLLINSQTFYPPIVGEVVVIPMTGYSRTRFVAASKITRTVASPPNRYVKAQKVTRRIVL